MNLLQCALVILAVLLFAAGAAYYFLNTKKERRYENERLAEYDHKIRANALAENLTVKGVDSWEEAVDFLQTLPKENQNEPILKGGCLALDIAPRKSQRFPAYYVLYKG
jgi:hypothetical protein